ncbi:MAG: PAC2 family protein [Methanomassiliicoccales archaeon]
MKNKKEQGPIVIEAFPGIGQVASLVGHYITQFFGLKFMEPFAFDNMPPVTLVKGKKPFPSAAVYGGKLPGGLKIAVITSDIPHPKEAVGDIATSVLNWSKKAHASLLISPHGMVVDDREEQRGVSIYGAASTEDGLGRLEGAGIETFEEGIITGIPGLLLWKGSDMGVDTVVLLAEVRDTDYDAGAAALMVHAVDRLCLNYDMDCGPLCRAAMELGASRLKGMAFKQERAESASGSMYL